ncbi:hypothetical protein TNCV_4621141 [Trichonephila clavipes]|nr:hypothetical protein TNCV_4621141 [Trichonephila clavipes]
MTTKEASKRSLFSSTAASNQGAARAFTLIPWVHRWDHSNGLILQEQVKIMLIALITLGSQCGESRLLVGVWGFRGGAIKDPE